MSAYNYKARNKFGKLINGIMEDASEDAVVTKLKQMGYTPISITQAKERTGLSNLFHRQKRVRFSDLNMFSRQFAALQKAGLPILVSLSALKEQNQDKVFRKTIEQMIKDIEGGASLSSALEKHPQIFNIVYINMIRSGEASGALDVALERVAALGEHTQKVHLRIKAAIRYPIFVATAVVVAFFVLITLVVPRFARLYSQFDTILPLPTRLLLEINYVITNFWWLLLVVVAASIFGFNRYINTEQGRFWWDNLKLRFPIFGSLIIKLTMSRFARITGILINRGIPLLQVLELTSKAVGNVVIARVIDKIKISVTAGKGLAEPMKNSSIFPPIVTQMVLVGEESGKVDELLLCVSDYYDSEVDYLIGNLVALIEPLLIAVLGGIVLFMALGIFLPMWNLIRLFTL